MFGKLYAVAANAFVETIRQPIYGVLMWAAAGLLMLAPATAAFSLESGGDTKVLQEVGLATLLLYALLASVFSATGVITREISDQTVLTVVSKPVSRPLFLTGKYLGVTGAVLAGYFFLSVVLFMAVRHGAMETAATPYDQPVLVFGGLALLVSLLAAAFGNYTYGWHFSSTLMAWVVPLGTLALVSALGLGKDWSPQSMTKDFGDLKLVYATALTFCGVLVLTALAVALSTRFSQVVTLMLCVGVYLVGLLSDFWFGERSRLVAETTDTGLLFDALYRAVPNFQFFWAASAITQELPIPGSQVAQVAVYALLYAAGILGLGVALFETREVG